MARQTNLPGICALRRQAPARIFLLAAVLLATALAAFAGEPREIPKGSALRAELFDLARPSVEKQAGQTVKFHGSLKELGDWAFFSGEIVDGRGRPILLHEVGSAETCILWKKSKGGWKVLRAFAGITDVAWQPWPEEFGTPPELLGLQDLR